MKEIIVNVLFDDDAKVYVAESDDVIGLVAEAETFELLHKKVVDLIPELLEANSHLMGTVPNIPIELLIQQKSILKPAH